MNLPSGATVKTGIDSSAVDLIALFRELKNKQFNGYLCITVQGFGGIEEGTVIFDNGKIVGSAYEYLLHSKELLGDAAFLRVLNASAAKVGVIDIYQLRNDQVQLILAFNEKIICLPSDADLSKARMEEFSRAFENQVLEVDKAVPRDSLLKKYGVSSVEKKPRLEKASNEGEEDLLKDLLAMKRREDDEK